MRRIFGFLIGCISHQCGSSNNSCLHVWILARHVIALHSLSGLGCSRCSDLLLVLTDLASLAVVDLWQQCHSSYSNDARIMTENVVVNGCSKNISTCSGESSQSNNSLPVAATHQCHLFCFGKKTPVRLGALLVLKRS